MIYLKMDHSIPYTDGGMKSNNIGVPDHFQNHSEHTMHRHASLILLEKYIYMIEIDPSPVG